MKAYIASAAIAALCALPASSAKLTPRQALARLDSIKNSAEMPMRAPSMNGPRLAATVGSIYVFNSDHGFMILPADDSAPALLAYSDSGQFEEGNPGVDYWIEYYNAELAAMPAQAASETVKRPERVAVRPLLATRWNQEAPYNDLCPKVNGHETVTGCVATAMSQVMKYHSYPEKGKGTHSYHWEPGDSTLSFDYASTTFEWDKMTDTYNSESTAEARKAVATLMLAAGISVDMHYDVGDSGASTIVMGASLIDYFDYDRGIWMPMRPYYGLIEWEDMIYADLLKGLPVLYAGEGTAGGHQFVCDGYSSDGFFHFNWGWGGMSDGYFLLTALNPASLGVGGGAGGFNSGQQIALGVQPPVNGSEPVYIIYNTTDFKTEAAEVSAGEILRCKGGFFSYSLTDLPDGSRLGMKITSVADRSARFEEGMNISGLPMLRGYDEDRIRFPELADGEYLISPAFYDGKKWNEVRSGLGYTGELLATVKDGKATISVPSEAKVEVTDVDVSKEIYAGRENPLEFTVRNTDSEEYYGKVIPVLLNIEDGTEAAASVYRPVDILPGSDERVTDYIANFKTSAGESPAVGKYNLVFRDGNGAEVSTPVEITLLADPGEASVKVSDFHLGVADPVVDKTDVRFDFKVECESGYFTDRLHIYIFPAEGGRDLKGGSTPMLYIGAGESADATVSMNLTELPAGEYMAMVYKGSEDMSGRVYFHLNDTPSGVSVTENDDAERNNAVYDLGGNRVTTPRLPGIYIVNGQKVLLR